MKAVYENRELVGLSAVKVKGFRGFAEMFHPHCEIVMITKGSITVSIEGRERILREGELCFVFPYCIHSYQEAPEAHGTILLFDAAKTGCFEGFLNSHVPKEPFVAVPRFAPLLDHIHALCHRGDSLSLQTATSYLQALTGELLSLLPCQLQKDAAKDVARQALIYCSEHYSEEDLSIRKLSSALFVSPGYLSKLFNRKLKTPFRQYLNELRLSKAKTLLSQSDKSVVEVMLESGFSNQSTFNRVFLGQYGLTPKEYRKRFAPEPEAERPRSHA